MTKINPLLSALLLITCCVSASDSTAFWNTPQHGGNSFNRLPPDFEYYKALKDYGATWVRLAYDKWQPERKDFLIGNADQYKKIPTNDLNILLETLDAANKAGIKVVIAPLSLPFMRWSQNNGDKFDDRLWRDKKNWNAAIQFWQDLAKQLKDHPAIAAYNLVNEPAPEKQSDLREHATQSVMQAWYKKEKGGSRDLVAFYEKVIAAIREVDTHTPIMVDAGWYAAADAFSYWPKALTDNKVLYSFHMYEPYEATSGPNLRRKKPYSYPGEVPYGDGVQYWGADQVAKYLEIPLRWAKARKIPPNRIVVGEFGCVRMLPGCKNYLEDVLNVIDQHRLHWAFYSFREDNWDAMDYELGVKKVHWKYWDAMEKGEPDPIQRQSSALFEIIRKRL